MHKLNHLWNRYATPQNRKALYIVISLIALAVASGAPSGFSGY
jgi:hypothetical protein